MALLRKMQLVAGGIIALNAFLWLGFPIRIEAIAEDGLVQSVSAGLYAAGLTAVLLPWTVERTKFVAPPMIGSAVVLAYALSLAAFVWGDSPLHKPLGSILLVVLATWTMSGGVALLFVGCWQPRWLATWRVLEPDEVHAELAAHRESALAD